MCGICGIVYFDRERRVEESLLRSMCAVMRHRGPDGEGILAHQNFGIGMRRLSIIDLQTGDQPIYNEDRTICIVFNGEIFNYPDLRKELSAKGHRFYTNADTEAIVHLYEDYKEKCVDFLNGQFAFAVLELNARSIFLARDRLGIKPLYYALTKDGFIFGSEIKCILESGVDRQVNINALNDYLTYQYVPSPKSMFRGIYKLPPAHYVAVSEGKLEIKRYWDVSYTNVEHKSEEYFVDRILDIVRSSVKMQLMSDVPLGAFLSGGMDSSALVCIMKEFMSGPVKTFSMGFDVESFNELPFARIIAKKFGTDHYEKIVKAPNVYELLPKLTWHYDEPFADSSMIPTYMVSQMARERVTVALAGDGGDELFGGYERYLADKLMNYYRLIPAFLRNNFFSIIADYIPEKNKQNDTGRRIKRFIKWASLPRDERYISWMTIIHNDLKEKLFLYKGLDNSINYLKKIFERADGGDFLSKITYVDTMSYIPEDLLTKTDRASMANSLEVRVPILDHRLVEFSATIPADMKVRGMQKKYILRKAFSRFLPKEIINKKKQGFGVPIGHWMRKGLISLFRDVLLNEKARQRGYFDSRIVETLIEAHAKGKRDYYHPLWILLIFELWHQRFIDKN